MIQKVKRVIEFYLGYKCNLRCKYCLTDKLKDKENGVDELRGVIEKHPENIDYIIISGGEPTLFKDTVIDIIRTFDKYKFNIVTNGTNLQDIIDIYNIDKNRVMITVSWDGHINDRGFDSYNTMKTLYDMGALDGLSMVISNTSYKYLSETFTILKNEFPKILLHNKMEINIAKMNVELYDIDYDILRDQLAKMIRIHPDCKLFADVKRRCVDLFSFSTECFYMHEGVLYDNGCVERIDNKDVLTYFEVCDTCPNTECKGRMCPMTLDTIGVKKDELRTCSYCKIQDVIHEVKTDYLNESYWNNKKKNFKNMEFILTTGCNLACKYCFQPHDIHNNFTVMSKEIVDKSFDEFIVNRTKDVNELMLFGGEPILPQTLDIRNYILDKMEKTPVKLIIVTNGYHLDENEKKWYQRLKHIAAGVGVQYSMDTIPSINDIYRVNKAGQGVFDKVFSNLKEVSQIIGINNIGINSVSTIENLPYLADWGEFITKNILGKYCNNFSLRFDQSRVDKMTDEEIKIVEDSFNKVIEYYESGRIDPVLIRTFFNMVKSEGYDKEYLLPGCEMCSKGVTVDPKGRVIPCHLFMSTDDEEMDELTIKNMITGEFNPDFRNIMDYCGSKYILKGIDKYCGDCDCLWECVKCKGAQIKNGAIENPLPFTCQINTLRHKIKINKLGHRFDAFTEKERDQFIQDFEDLRALIQSNELDKATEANIAELLLDMEKIYKERMW